MADQFIIEEAEGPDPITVTLEKHEMPFGRPRRGAAFDLGGPVNHDEIWLDGRTTPIIHAKQAQFHPIILKGHFRDRFKENDGDAWAFVQKLESIRGRMRPLKLSWWNLTWKAFMADGKFPVEGTSDFTYEMHFKILEGPGAQQKEKDPDALLQMTSAPSDLAAQVQQMLSADRLKIIGFFVLHTAANAINSAFDNVDAAMTNLQDAAAAFENAPASANAEAQALISKATEASNRCSDLSTALDNLNAPSLSAGADGIAPSGPAAPGGVLADTSATSQNAYWAWLTATWIDILTAQDALRTMRFTARQRINKATQIYIVADGDTLESIAEAKLGSASQAQLLGYKPGDLKRGRQIRIPRKV